MIDDTLEHGHTFGMCKQFFDLGQPGTPHGAEHTARQPEARKGLKHLGRTRVDGNIATSRDEISAVIKMRAIHEQRERLHAGIERTLYDLGRLGDEDALFRLKPVT